MALRDSIQTASTRLGLDGLPVRLLRYVAMIAVGGPLTVVITAIIWYRPLSSTELLWAAMLLVLAGIAERFPLHLTHKTNINIAAGAFIVMVLLLPWWLPGVLALLAVGAAQTMRRPEPIEGAFNTGQSALYVTAGAACFAAVGDLALGPTVGTIGSLGAIVIASATMHLLNTMLVALAGALQLGANPLRVWWGTIALDLMPQVTLTALGTIAALLAIDQPLVLPFLALPAALVHHSVRQTIQLRVDTHEALASLVEVMELRDPYTAGHSRRVAALSRIVAERMGLTAEEADIIEQAGRVHDIGKAALDSNILSKEGELNDDEWQQMKMHPVHGANVVARFAAYRSAAGIVRHHHEEWSGGGYPDRLAGEEIPLGARILAVADSYDAMTTDRPYRDALSVELAVSILERGAGSQWDARVVKVVTSYLRETHTQQLDQQARPPFMDEVLTTDDGRDQALRQPAT